MKPLSRSRLLGIDELRVRLNSKFDISNKDGELAIDYLLCFFDWKLRAPNELIILPQIADWAWHELILNTRQYRNICLDLFGEILPHVKIMHNNPLSKAHAHEAFTRSMQVFNFEYGLPMGDNTSDWVDAGWNRPSYRLRTPMTVDSAHFNAHESDDHVPIPFTFAWLLPRLMQRFSLSKNEAKRGIAEYVDFVHSLRKSEPSCDRMINMSRLGQAAWEEHILWTDRYAADCNEFLGYFLNYSDTSVRIVQ